MNRKPKQIITYIALAFFLIATVLFPLYLSNQQMGGGWVGAILLITFIIGGGLGGFVIIINGRDMRAEQRRKEAEEDLKETPETAEADLKKDEKDTKF